MQTKLQELTEKIYQEGVTKARDEADNLLANARKEAEDILANARKEAEGIVKSAEKEASELKHNSMNELQLSARQLISDTRQKLVNLIEGQVVEPEARAAFKDVEFTREVIQTMVKNWNPKGDESVDISLLLPTEKQDDFEKFFKGKTAELLGKGVELSFTDKIKGGFKVGPKDGGYLLSFSDGDFDNLFRGYLRPRLIEMLYKKD